MHQTFLAPCLAVGLCFVCLNVFFFLFKIHQRDRGADERHGFVQGRTLKDAKSFFFFIFSFFLLNHSISICWCHGMSIFSQQPINTLIIDGDYTIHLYMGLNRRPFVDQDQNLQPLGSPEVGVSLTVEKPTTCCNLLVAGESIFW